MRMKPTPQIVEAAICGVFWNRSWWFWLYQIHVLPTPRICHEETELTERAAPPTKDLERGAMCLMHAGISQAELMPSRHENFCPRGSVLHGKRQSICLLCLNVRTLIGDFFGSRMCHRGRPGSANQLAWAACMVIT